MESEVFCEAPGKKGLKDTELPWLHKDQIRFVKLKIVFKSQVDTLITYVNIFVFDIFQTFQLLTGDKFYIF